MRSFAAWLLVLFTFPLLAIAEQPAPAVVITAQQLALYSDRRLLIGDGGVSVRAATIQLTGTRAVYDLTANTLTLSGDVSATQNGNLETGTGYIYDYKSNRGRFVTDANVPQLSTTEATAIAQQADLHPGTSITFTNASVRSGTILTPIASYTYAIPPPNAKDFGYSPVPSAALEWPVLLSTGRNAYSFARFRYNRYNGGPGAGLEEHYARTGRGYIALGETLDVDGGRFDLGVFQRMNDKLTQSLTGSTLLGTKTLRYSINRSGKYGYSSLSFSQYNASRSDDLYFTDNAHAIGRIGSLREQIDLGHDVHPYNYSGAQDLRMTPGLHFDTATVHIGPSTISSSADLGETIYNYGVATLSSDASFWSTFPASTHLQFNGGATFAHNAPPFPATLRTYVAGATWKASPAFNVVSSLTYTNDYGQAPGIGRPGFSAAFDVRFRRKNGMGIEIGSIVPFGTGNLYQAGAFNFRIFK